MQRVEQIGWTRYYLRDLESDFSRFHRIDDMWSMPAPRFFAFAYRIAAYGGMLARRIDAENYEPPPQQIDRADLYRDNGRPQAGAARSEAARAAAPGRMPMSDKSARVLPFAAFAAMHSGVVERARAPRDNTSTPSD